MKDDRVYLLHIVECIRRIEEVAASGQKAFESSHIFQDAPLRNLQVLSESTQRLSDSLKQQHPDIEWRRIAAFRNVLVHDYLGIDLDRVSKIIWEDLPRLSVRVNEIIASLESSRGTDSD